MAHVMLAAADVDVSAHMPLATHLSLAAIACVGVMFLVRADLWRRLLLTRIDPRPAGLTRILLGSVVLWTYLDLIRDAKFLFTDEGMWLTKMARHKYGGKLRTLWDPEHGFEHGYDAILALGDRFSVLHLRSDPPFVYTLYAFMLICLTLMAVGKWTRVTTLLSWVLIEQFYGYSPIFYTGGDIVIRVMMFLGIFCRWGEAYSLDAWQRSKRAILGSAKVIPALRRIPAWPQRLMMLQLAIIYSATGLLKSGPTWANGTALYYALCLDHFYRFPGQTRVAAFLHYIGVLPTVTIWVHWWEILFPVVLIGLAARTYERERSSGNWPQVSRWRRWLGYGLFAGAWGCGSYITGLGVHYFVPSEVVRRVIPAGLEVPLVTAATATIPLVAIGIHLSLRRWFPRGFGFVYHWLLGRRVWLVWGFMMHIGIDLSMNVGTFAQVMMASYFAWPTGDEVAAAWRYLASRPAAPGQAGRPVRRQPWQRHLLAPLDRLRFRVAGPRYICTHHPDETSIRQAGLLRLWDLCERIEFVASDNVAPRSLTITVPGHPAPRTGNLAGASLTAILPGLWWLRPLAILPGFNSAAGALALRVLGQRP